MITPSRQAVPAATPHVRISRRCRSPPREATYMLHFQRNGRRRRRTASRCTASHTGASIRRALPVARRASVARAVGAVRERGPRRLSAAGSDDSRPRRKARLRRRARLAARGAWGPRRQVGPGEKSGACPAGRGWVSVSPPERWAGLTSVRRWVGGELHGNERAGCRRSVNAGGKGGFPAPVLCQALPKFGNAGFLSPNDAKPHARALP